MLNDITFDIPFGPKNLKPLFPQLPWENMQDYFIELLDENDQIVISTPQAVVSKASTSNGLLILHFLNYLSRFDAVVFYNHSISDEIKSESWTKALPFNPLKKDYGTVRSNISAREIYSAVTVAYSERQMRWLEELFESPLAYLQWESKEGEQDDYIPVVVLDKTMEVRKKDERYIYEFAIEFKAANEKIPLRI